MFSNKLKKIICVALLICISLITSNANAYNTILLMWARHQNCSFDPSVIYLLHVWGSQFLQADADGGGTADYYADTCLQQWGNLYTSFTYSGGDDTVDSSAQIGYCVAKMSSTPIFDALAVTSIYDDYQYVRGHNLNGRILISWQDGYYNTLVHEVGHICGLSDLNPYDPAFYERIMRSATTGLETYIIASERDEYQGGSDY